VAQQETALSEPGTHAGQHRITVSSPPSGGVQLHLSPEPMCVDEEDGRLLVCWPPEVALQVAQRLAQHARRQLAGKC